MSALDTIKKTVTLTMRELIHLQTAAEHMALNSLMNLEPDQRKHVLATSRRLKEIIETEMNKLRAQLPKE